jgi:hypothetical protein
LDIRSFTESLNLLRGGSYVHASMLAELLQHLEHYGEFLLGEHPNLEVKMRTPLGFASHSVLPLPEEFSTGARA